MSAPKLFTKNFTLLIFGQISSLFGNMILRFALSMYILEITGSATIFAGILAATMIPTILLSPFGGILADRANRRNIMVLLDFLSGIVVLIAIFTLSEQSPLSVITVILFALSILGAFESPTVQACVPQMQSGDNVIKANAVVNQVAAVAGLIAPILGSVLYTAFGLKPVMIVTALCFFLTAMLECFIRLPYTKRQGKQTFLQIVREDFSVSMKFIFKDQPHILRLLLLTALTTFFVIGTATVGLPYIVRNILGLNAGYYGAAESILGVAAIAGSLAAGLLTTKLKLRKMHLVLSSLGLSLLPAGFIFLFPAGNIPQYAVTVLSICLVQFAASLFSIFALSAIQQRTPNELLGKIMAYVVTITMCAQPFGQMIYGVLFDRFHNDIYLVLIPTAVIVALIGWLSKKSFYHLDQ